MSIIGIDLGTKTGWASCSRGIYTSGTINLKGGRYEGGGMRYLRFRKWFRELLSIEKPTAVYFEEVRRHLSTDSAHVYGGLLAELTAECELAEIPYEGIPVQTIKKTATGRGNAKKDAMVEAAINKWPDQGYMTDDQADALWILETGLTQQ